MSHSLIKYFLAALLSFLLIKFLAQPAVRIGLVDHPGGRKRHEGAVPLTGGPAMLVGFCFGALSIVPSLYAYRPLFAALGLLVVVGLLDDLQDLAPAKKFAAQIVAALFMTSWGGVYVSQLGDLLGFGPLLLREWGIPFTVVCVLGIINAVNMIDGVDGLAGGLSLVALLFFGVSALLVGQAAPAQLLFVMTATVLGFLVLNIRHPWQSRAQAFMGDSGSMMLGLFLTWFSVELTQGAGERLPPIVAVWFLGVPILDMGLVTVRRIMKGVSPFRASRDHFHHVLLLAGFSPARTVNLLLLTSILLASIGFFAWRTGIPEWMLFYSFMALFGAYYLLSLRAWRLVRILRRFRGGPG